MWGATHQPQPRRKTLTHFNPRAPCGARQFSFSEEWANLHFNPRAPCGARPQLSLVEPNNINFNPRAPCGARLQGGTIKYWTSAISIHTPRVGRDDIRPAGGVFMHDFNPHAPCGARLCKMQSRRPSKYFNPHAPCGARPYDELVAALNAGFQSTRPVWGATALVVSMSGRVRISIHTPRVGRDRARAIDLYKRQDFNPRAPCGARRSPVSVQRARSAISIHAPRVGRDRMPSMFSVMFGQFQSTRPVWGATTEPDRGRVAGRFQSTRPVWGATRWSC